MKYRFHTKLFIDVEGEDEGEARNNLVNIMKDDEQDFKNKYHSFMIRKGIDDYETIKTED